MSLGFQNAGVLTAYYSYDFASQGGATGAIAMEGAALPEGAVPVRGFLKVVEEFTSGGAATVVVGDSGDADGYLESVGVASLGADEVLALDGDLIPSSVGSAGSAPLLTVGTAALTAGKAVLVVEYHRPVIED